MVDNKKRYIKPKFTVHGGIDRITNSVDSGGDDGVIGFPDSLG